MTVHVYTSGDSVTLRLNGNDIQTQAVAATDRRLATFMVPHTAGELTAIASLGGKTIGVKTLKTTGKPAALKLTSDVPLLTTSRDDLAHVLVQVLDQHGSLVPDAVTQVGTVALSDPMIIGQEDLSSAGARRPPDARFSLPDGLRAYT
jgi:beta-galactosidase